VDHAWLQRLKLNYVEPLSTIAFKFNLRRYTMDQSLLVTGDGGGAATVGTAMRRLTGNDMPSAVPAVDSPLPTSYDVPLLPDTFDELVRLAVQTRRHNLRIDGASVLSLNACVNPTTSGDFNHCFNYGVFPEMRSPRSWRAVRSLKRGVRPPHSGWGPQDACPILW